MEEKKESLRGCLDRLEGKCARCKRDMEGQGCLDHGEELCRSCFIGPDTIHVATYSSFGPWSACW